MSMHPTHNLFKEFPNKYFVETGSHLGAGIELALEAEFKHISSIELSHEYFEVCKTKFWDHPFVELWGGDSALMLGKVIENINEPITFWLDSHWQMLEGEEKPDNPWPLLKELEQIKQHPVKSHTLIIDDMWILSHPEITGWTSFQIQNALFEINPDYKLTYFANPVINNILVAHL